MQHHSATVAHSHLFPGAVIEASGDLQALLPHPLRIRLDFDDGTTTQAEILARDTKTWIAVEAHTTRAGTQIPPRTWQIKGIEPNGQTTRLRLGGRCPRS